MGFTDPNLPRLDVGNLSRLSKGVFKNSNLGPRHPHDELSDLLKEVLELLPLYTRRKIPNEDLQMQSRNSSQFEHAVNLPN